MTISRRDFLAAAGTAAGALVGGCAGTATAPGTARPSVRTVNVHAHWYPQEWVDVVEKDGPANGVKLGRTAKGYLTMSVPGFTAPFTPERVDLGVRLKMMDAANVDVHALSLTSPMVYWASPAFGLKLSQAYNDGCARAHREHPDRFYGLAMLPMQDPKLALEELNRAARLPGLRGAYMATNVN